MGKRIYDFPYMTVDPLNFFKCLSDETRLVSLLLIVREQELCVCELTEALGVVQPKVSRHLAHLRESGLLLDRREGQWIYYHINPELPLWVKEVLSHTLSENIEFLAEPLNRLQKMGNRPQRKMNCR